MTLTKGLLEQRHHLHQRNHVHQRHTGHLTTFGHLSNSGWQRSLVVAAGNQETSHQENVQHRKGESEKAGDYLAYFGLERYFMGTTLLIRLYFPVLQSHLQYKNIPFCHNVVVHPCLTSFFVQIWGNRVSHLPCSVDRITDILESQIQE